MLAYMISSTNFSEFPNLLSEILLRILCLSLILKNNYHKVEFKDFKNPHFLRNMLVMVIKMKFSQIESKISFQLSFK